MLSQKGENDCSRKKLLNRHIDIDTEILASTSPRHALNTIIFLGPAWLPQTKSCCHTLYHSPTVTLVSVECGGALPARNCDVELTVALQV